MLHLYASPEQRERWLEAAGRRRRSTRRSASPSPRSRARDPTLMQTHAELDGDEWVINGHKWFTSGANVAAFTTVFCKTEPDHTSKHRAVLARSSCPPTRPATRSCAWCRPWATAGGGHCEIRLNNVRVPTDNLLGGRAARASSIAQKRLGPGRIFHCMRWLGQAQRAFELMCDRANTRFAHGSLLAEKGEIQRYIAESAAEIQAARLMTLDAARVIDEGGDARVADRAHQVLGRAHAAQRDRPRHPGARRARRHRRHARSRRCTARRATPASTTGPTRSTA